MPTSAPAFAAWLDEFFASYYRYRPVTATFIGVHDGDDRLADYSESGVDEVVSEMEALRRRLASLPEEPLSEAEAIDRCLAEAFLEIQLWEYGSGRFHRANPCLYTGEAVFGVLGLLLRPFAPFARRVHSAVARLKATGRLLEQGKRQVRQAPFAWTERAIKECTGALRFLRGGVETLIEEHRGEGAELLDAAEPAARAFGEFQQYLSSELIHRPTGAYACGGQALHRLVRRGHFLEEDLESLERRAEERLRQSEEALRDQASARGAADWKEALVRLEGEHPSPQGYYERFRDLWEACRRTVEEHQVLSWPDAPVRFIPVPPWVRSAAPHLYFLSYRSPAPFDSLEVTEVLVPPLEPTMSAADKDKVLRRCNDSVIKLNYVVHHAGTGHHVQNAYAYRSSSRLGQVAAVDGASRIAMFCGGTMAEGWACYATELMEELGFLTPLERLSEQHTRLRMAGRALVDIRLHVGELSLDEAARFYEERIGMSAAAARSEAVKNSMFPGTGLMYLFGTEVIRELRRELQQRLRAEFDLKRFHERFLSYGSVPVALVAESMRKRSTL